MSKHNRDLDPESLGGDGAEANVRNQPAKRLSHICPTCGKAFSRTRDLERHISTHTGNRPHVCETCGKAFSTSVYLVQHMQNHTGKKTHVCETCDKEFSKHSDMIQHMRTHTGEKPYVCETCNKAFSKSSHLVVHMRKHTGEKPYVCETCGKAFSQSSNLSTHMRTHLGEKSQDVRQGLLDVHVCKTCGKVFSTSTGLVMHMRTHEASAFDVTPLPHPLPQAHDTERVIGDRRSVGGDETNDPDEVGPGSTDEEGTFWSYVLNHTVWGNVPPEQDVIAAAEDLIFFRSTHAHSHDQDS
jgi:uncharacterized Zn-finger protein